MVGQGNVTECLHSRNESSSLTCYCTATEVSDAARSE
jgi:hypothetical protein